MRFIIILTLAGILGAQTRPDRTNRTSTGSVDFGGTTSTIPNKSGTSLPATCSVGMTYFKTDATAGKNLYLCTATNTWTQVNWAALGANTDITSLYLDNTGLKIKDTNASHGLILAPGSNITADRTLTITTGDASRTLTLNGDTTLSGTHTGTSSGTNTGDQTITLTGDVSGSGTGSISVTISTLAVGKGGSGTTSLTGVLKGNGTSAFSAATAGTDFVSPGAATTYSGGFKQTFGPNATNAGINVGSVSGAPSTLSNGDIWYDSSAAKFKCRENGATANCIGQAASGSNGYVQFATSGAFNSDSGLVWDNSGKILNITGELYVSGLTSTGSASGKKVVCVDTATGQLFASTGTASCL